jgi:hypothetical protein
MPNLTPKEVVIAITRLTVHFPNAKLDTGQMTILAEDWYEEFRHLNSEQFQMAVKLTRSRCKWFPTIADVNEALSELRDKYRERQQIARDQGQVRQITEAPSYKSELDIERNQQRLAILNRMMLKEITPAQAEKEMAAI